MLPTLGEQGFGFSLTVIETNGLSSFLHGYLDLWIYSIPAEALSRLFAITGDILTIGFVAFAYKLVAIPQDYAFAQEIMTSGLFSGWSF